MNIGETVTWTSHGGKWAPKTKTGVIVAVVPAETYPDRFALEGMMLRTDGGWRNHESYLVKVGNAVYWPRVSQLRKVKGDGK